MFWRNAVADCTGLLHAASVYQGAAPVQGGTNNVLARHLRQQFVDGRLNRVNVCCVRAQQNTLCEFVVLGLTEQIHGYPIGRRAAIGQHQYFRGSGNHVNANRAKHAPFGRRHVRIPRASDFVDPRHRGSAVGHGRDSLRPADGECTTDTSHIRRRQYQFVTLTACGGLAATDCAACGHAAAHRCRYHHDDLANTCYMRRYGIHQQARRVSRFAAWHVNTCAVQGRDFLAEQTAVGVAVLPAFAAGFFLCLVVAANTRSGVLQRTFLRLWQAIECSFEIRLLQLQLSHASGLQAIKACGVVQHGSVAARFHIRKNVSHALLNSGIGIGRPMQALLKQGFKIGLGSGQAKRAGVHGKR